MSEVNNPFGQQIDEKLAAQRLARMKAAHAKKQAQLDLEAYKLSREIKNAQPVGMPIEQFFGPEEQQACTDFLDYMASKNFPGAKTLKARTPKPTQETRVSMFGFRSRTIATRYPTWSIKGYYLGVLNNTPNGTFRRSARTHEELALYPHGKRAKRTTDQLDPTYQGVFLCADKTVRYLNDRFIEVMPTDEATQELLSPGTWRHVNSTTETIREYNHRASDTVTYYDFDFEDQTLAEVLEARALNALADC